MHLKPAIGAPRPVGRAIVDHLFQSALQSGRIPIVGVVRLSPSHDRGDRAARGLAACI